MEDKKMTATTLILIVVISIVCSIIAIYFYDRKLMREISEYEKKMYKKKHWLNPYSIPPPTQWHGDVDAGVL